MKNSQWIGIAASILLVAACFLPWAWYPDLQESFTGFFSEKNTYGRPGKILLFFGIVATILFLAPRVWAKRANVLVCAITIAFCIKNYIVYTGCYRGICPEKKIGIFLTLFAAALMTLCAVLPDTKLKEK